MAQPRGMRRKEISCRATKLIGAELGFFWDDANNPDDFLAV
jgi:hypothetical protein